MKFFYFQLALVGLHKLTVNENQCELVERFGCVLFSFMFFLKYLNTNV